MAGDATDEVVVAPSLDCDRVVPAGVDLDGGCCIAGMVVGSAHLHHIVIVLVVCKYYPSHDET